MEDLMKNNPGLRVKSGDQTASVQHRSHPPKESFPAPPSNLSFLNMDIDEAVQSYRSSNVETEEDEEVEDEEYVVEDIEDEDEDGEEEEESEEEDEDNEEVAQDDDLANKNPGQKLQYTSLFGTGYR
jgi:hypothetical protein